MNVVDVVNFNADASCLGSGDWLAYLNGGRESRFCRWLELYVRHTKPIVLGLTGATIADLAGANPEAIELIRSHPRIFQIIARPFSHDICLLRTRLGFRVNLHYGLASARREFAASLSYYLPPEFMCNAMQIRELERADIAAIFINPRRFDVQTARHIPQRPYRVQGILGSSLPCLPFDDRCGRAYLESLHDFSSEPWSAYLRACGGTRMSWRDGESSFLLPAGLEREETWLQNEDRAIERILLPAVTALLESDEDARQFTHYPIHSFAAWVREMKMYWYVAKIHSIEDRLDRLALEQVFVWLQAINSDILSSVEKASPEVRLREVAQPKEVRPFVILRRQEKSTEGEDYLEILERLREDNVHRYLASSSAPHMRKLRQRMKYLATLPRFLPNGLDD